MKGLFVKDIILLKTQKYFLALILLMMFVFTIAFDNSSFAITYVTFLVSLLGVSTLSFDDQNHGNQFLFTLPFDRASYVQEKYLLPLLSSIAAWLVIVLLSGVNAMVRLPASSLTELLIFHSSPFFLVNYLFGNSLCLVMVFLFLGIQLPLNFKFGAEKSRFLMVLLICFFMCLGGSFLATLPELLEDLENVLSFDTMGVLSFVFTHLELVYAAVFLASLLFLGLSYFISLRIVRKKEF